MKRLSINSISFYLLLLMLLTAGNSIAQTPFTGPVMSTQTGASSSFNALVIGPETINGGCSEVGQTWTHNFAGTANKKLNGFTITGTSYYVNNYGSLTTIMRRNNASGLINNTASSCARPTAVPWNDRQIAFFEGSVNTVTNVASIVNSFPSTTLPGTAGYNAINEMNLVFSRGYINSGADNIFNNNSGTGSTPGPPVINYNSNANNIERMDVFVSGGVLVTAANMNRVGIVIACRGPADDPFTISAIKGLTGGTNIGGGSSYVYDDILKFNATWTTKTVNGGAGIIPAGSVVTLLSSINCVVLRRMDSLTTMDDQLLTTDYPTASSTVLAQNIVGMFFTFANLGLVAGETFYGYSVGGFDVPAINSDQFNSYLNSTYYPLATNPADGGIDLAGFPGLFAAMDIDDDDDGLPDYLEANLANTFGDADSDGILNYCDATYAGFVDNNADGINDNFDPSADSDNDGIPNYRDNSFPGYVDSNADLVNDNFDWDLDGIPNHLDRDSDNDGIPDVVESFGVDANGDGIIDNYTDTDVDGLSQNVDGNSSGAISSGVGLGAIDTDSDGIPNYMDLDSDNDGIPDVVEAYGTDVGNDGKIDGYSDTDADGFSDNVDGDVGNDNFAENSAACLLLTGTDGNSDGRTDSWPNKNMDADSKPNPYDLDSDGDGITDVKEAQFTDANWDGRVDGAINSKGWNAVIAAMGSLPLPNTDAIGKTNPYDIDSDEDGIPDNVEGLTTNGYLLPASADTDLDGIDNNYDNYSGFGGDGIHPVDKDGDTQPDYLDSDTDGDGVIDRIEGNDFNFNGKPDDNVTLTGLDTDDDGLDNRFDNNNSNVEATSAYMGNGGSTTGDLSPGSITVVQKTAMASGLGCGTERDWRCVFYVLKCEMMSFKAVLHDIEVNLDWTLLCSQDVNNFILERSTDGTNFTTIATIAGRPFIHQTESFTATDNIGSIPADIFYYRLISVFDNGRTGISSIITVKRNTSTITELQVIPNPVRSQMQILVNTERSVIADVAIIDANGKLLHTYKQVLKAGNNTFTDQQGANLPQGIYYLRLTYGDLVLTKRFSVIK